MMTLPANEDVAQKCTLNELARLLALLSNDEANNILYQSAVEMAVSSNNIDHSLGGIGTCTERTRSSSEGSPAGSPRKSAPLWEMQAPTNPYNLGGLLSILDDYEETFIITVRKIHRLGFKSARALRKHFQGFGAVEKVLLLPSRPKTSDPELKPRPASMGFIVMQSAEAACAALRQKDTHLIQGWPVFAQKFVRRDSPAQDCSDD